MMASWLLSLAMVRRPRLLLRAWRVIQLPLLHGRLLRPALSILSMSGLGAWDGLLGSSFLGLGLPVTATGDSGWPFVWGMAMLLGPQIYSIMALSKISPWWASWSAP